MRQIDIERTEFNSFLPSFFEKSQMLGIQVPLQSDLVELSHCSLEGVDVANFSAWASPILNQTMHKVKQQNVSQSSQQEWNAELLEIYATQYGYCDFSRYQPSVPHDTPNLERSTHVVKEIASRHARPGTSARVVFCIIAYQDAKHLNKLIQAIHQPHHIILVHLERSTPTDYARQVEELASHYDNVVILQFGTVIYKTDAVSMINFRIMRWIEQLKLDYDYFAAMGGAVYPLYNATSMSQYLFAQSKHKNVWLGEMTMKGAQVNHPQARVLMQRRLISTSEKIHQSIKFPFGQDAPDWIDKCMRYKTASGNQAVYSKSTIQKLLDNPQVAELFARAKYGCCSALEERTWIAALDLVGLLDEAKRNHGTWQAWGGYDSCRGSMHNALLSMNESICLRLEYPGSEMYVSANMTLGLLKQAKKDGFLFARKFRSDDSSSMEVLASIEQEIWQNNLL